MGPCAGALAAAAALAAVGIAYLQLRPLPTVPDRYNAPQSEAEWRAWAGKWQLHEQCQGADPLEPAVRAVPSGLCGKGSIAGQDCAELKRRIKAGLSDLPDESLPGSSPHGWDYGMQTPFLREVGIRWLAALEPGRGGVPSDLEAAASAFPAFSACVAGLQTHMLRLNNVRLPLGAVRHLLRASLRAADASSGAADTAALLAGSGALSDFDAAAARLADLTGQGSSAGKRPLLVLLHGWPSGPAEYLPVLRAVKAIDADARARVTADGRATDAQGAWIELDVVVPALPGFGQSAPAVPRGDDAAFDPSDELWSLRRRGPDAVDLAHWLAALPRALGYAPWSSADRGSAGYFVAGGDYGGLVAGVLAQVGKDPALLGVHLSMWPVQAQRPLTLARTVLTTMVPEPLLPLARSVGAVLDGEDTARLGNGSLTNVLGALAMQTGYMHQQATFPDTLAATLRGNPLGTAAWILDKLVVWTAPCYEARGDGFEDPGACFHARYPLAPALLLVHDHLRSVRAPLRLYRDAIRSPRSIACLSAAVPSRVALLSLEQETLFRVPFAWAGDKFQHVAQIAALPGSGHFAGLETPLPLLADVLRFVVGTLADGRGSASSAVGGAGDEL